MEKIRVLHVLSSLWSGGVAVLLKNYYEHMDKDKVQFDFIVHTPIKGITEEYFESTNSRIYRLPPLKRIVSSFFATYRIIRKNKYKIVHVHHTDVSFVQLLAAKIAGAKVRIAHSHDELFPKGRFQKLKRKLFCCLTTKFSNYHFACSESAGKYVFGEKIKLPNYLYIHNAISYEKFRFNYQVRLNFRRELGFEDCFVVGNVGRLAEQKNPFFTIDVFYELLKIAPEARLLLIGKGLLQEKIEERLKDLKIENFVKLIEVTTETENYMFAMDAFLFPSLHEGLGIAFIEAQASGLPCIVSNVIPKEAFVNSTNVIALSLNDTPREWAKKVYQYKGIERNCDFSQTLIDNYNIPEEAAKLQNWYIEKGTI